MDKVILNLQRLQADTYILMLKTHNFHWNVSGPFFQSLHTLFENQYNELFLAVDEIAERIKSLEGKALGRYKDFQKLSSIEDSKEEVYQGMIKDLIHSNNEVVKTAKGLLKIAQGKDEASADLAIKRIQIHEKNLWMLRSHLK